MKSLFLDSSSAIKVKLGLLDIEHNGISETYKPNRIPYDSIILNRYNGYVSFEAIRMLADKNIAFTILDYSGNIKTQITENSENGVRRIKQYQKYLNERENYSKAILKGKFQHSIDFINYLKQRYTFEMPAFETISKASSQKEILGIEGINANRYWMTVTKIIKDNFPKWKYEGRTHENGRSMNSDSELNALFNFGYKLLEVSIRKSLNITGLDVTVGFIHEIRPSKDPLVYDMQEPFRFLVDLMIINALENRTFNIRSDFFRTREYIYRIKDTAKAKLIYLFDSVLSETVKYKGLNQTWSNVIQLKCNEFAKSIDSGLSVNFENPAFNKKRTDTSKIRSEILNQSYTETAKAGRSKGTLWYRKKKIENGLPLKIYKARAR